MNIQIKDFTFSQYFSILEILNKDQYTYFDHPKTKKKTRSEKPLPKTDRTDEFMFELHREVVRQMTGLGKDYIKEDTFIVLCWDLISEKLHEINELLAAENLEEVNETFDFKGTKIGYTSFENWTFNKWVSLENAMKGVRVANENGDFEIVEHGAKSVLPVCFGVWDNEMKDYAEKYDFFNNQVLAKDMAFVFAKVNNWINALKKAHYPMYSYEQSSDIGKNYALHVEIFGWQETLKSLAEKRVFGGYLETKNAPLLQVLEYLNCSVSAEIAKEQDFKQQNKQQ